VCVCVRVCVCMCVCVCVRKRERERERIRKDAWESNVHTNRKCDVILVEQKQFCKMDVCVCVNVSVLLNRDSFVKWMGILER